ncbi:MAG: MBOAT family O-acyltransferase [Gemmiger sp.]
MSLQSFGFFAFFAVVAAVYLHLPQKAQSPFLLAASWVFYAVAVQAMGHPAMFAVTLSICLFTYLCGRGVAWRGGAHKTAFVRLGVIGCLCILGFFKYFNALTGISDPGYTGAMPALVMPLGISFYTFAAISYLVDAGRGDCPAERNFLHYSLFLTFFGTVTQGPICRAGKLLPQFKKEHRFDAARLTDGLRLFALGLFKLVAVSDVLGLVVDEVFPNYRGYGGPMLVLAAVLYTFQLYFNFCGYSEVARAVGLILGLELPENFKTPFFSTNFSGFWSRWHISLSGWLQEYLFLPLAWADTSRLTRGKRDHLPTEVCVFLVFFLSGFWHGNTAPFIVWGLLQALYRVGEELLHRRLGKPKKKAPAKVLWAKRAGVFVLWTVSMVFFRIGSGPNGAEALGAADGVRYLAQCFTGWSPARFGAELYGAVYTGFYANAILVAAYCVFMPAVLALGFWLDWRRAFRHRNKPAETVLAALPGRARTTVYYALVVCILAGYIIQSGGFGSSGFGMYAGF